MHNNNIIDWVFKYESPDTLTTSPTHSPAPEKCILSRATKHRWIKWCKRIGTST